MERYEKYKPSGIEWIGEVPEHWERKSFKLATNIIMGQSPSGDDIKDEGNCLFMQGNAEFGEKYPNAVYYCDNCSKHSRVGDVLMSVRAPVGELNYSDQVYGIGRGLCSIKPTGVSSGFLWYYLWKSKEDFNAFANGSTFTAITVETLKSFPMVIPSLAEQEAIAAYLDARCADIDKVVATQEKRIALLKELKQSVITQAVTRGLNPDVKMKDSSVEWIGEVPEHWEICRLKNTLKENLMYGANESAECDNPDFPRYIRITDMTDDGKLRDETFKSLEPEKAKPYLLKRGDMLFARSGATVGKTFLFDMDIEACFAGYLIKASFNKTTLPKYVYYYSQSGIYENWKNSVFIQATIQNIGAEKYANLPFIRPNIEEQRGIVKYLDSKCEEIDRQINGVTRQIDLLREYKQSLITEVVTGKRKVY